MVKKPGVPLLKNRIKRKSAQLKKAGLTSPVKLREEKRFFLWDEDSPEEGLEDTPVVCVQPEQPLLCKAAAPAQTEPPVEPEKPAKRAHITHRRQNAVIGALHSAADAATRLFSPARKKSRGNAAALEFAESHKRLGRRGRRKRKILVYGGSAIAVVAAVLLVLLVPGGAAAPSGAQSTATQVADVTASAAVSGSAAVITTATVTANATTAYSAPVTPSKAPTPTPIPTTAPDPTEIPIDMDELLEYYVVDADLYYNEVGYSNNHYEYTQDELHILAQLIWGEARGQTLEGKIAVANVVMNRVLNKRAFANTIKDVVTAPGQFSGYKSTNPTSGCVSAARWVLDYEVWVIPQDVYYFRASSRYSSLEGQAWGGHPYYGEISGHYFYRQSLLGRMRNGGVPPKLFDRTFKYAQYGCKPEDRVYRIQYMLDALGYDIESLDSYFGEGTEEALIQFQQDHGLDDDGVAGPATVRALIEAFGTREYFAKFCTD